MCSWEGELGQVPRVARTPFHECYTEVGTRSKLNNPRRKMAMQKPTSVKYAEMLIWLSLAVSMVIALVQLHLGQVTSGALVFGLMLLCAYCIIPYKIAQGSNAARYVFVFLNVVGYALLMSGVAGDTPRIEAVAAWVELPFTAFTAYLLFRSESSPWFAKRAA